MQRQRELLAAHRDRGRRLLSSTIAAPPQIRPASPYPVTLQPALNAHART